MSRVRASSRKIYFCSPGFLPGSQQYDQTSETKVETIKIKNEKLSNIVNFVTFWKLVSWKSFHSCWSLSALKSIVTSFFFSVVSFFPICLLLLGGQKFSPKTFRDRDFESTEAHRREKKFVVCVDQFFVEVARPWHAQTHVHTHTRTSSHTFPSHTLSHSSV